MPAKVDPELAGRLEVDPEAEIEAIVMAASDLDDLIASLPQDVTVRHRYRLIRGVAVRAPAAVVRRLAELATVESIEPVRAVHGW